MACERSVDFVWGNASWVSEDWRQQPRHRKTYSGMAVGLEASPAGADRVVAMVLPDEDEVEISVGETGTGAAGGAGGGGDSTSIRVTTEKGALWGRGEMSIESIPGPGDEDGKGGVVVVSARGSTKPDIRGPCPQEMGR